MGNYHRHRKNDWFILFLIVSVGFFSIRCNEADVLVASLSAEDNAIVCLETKCTEPCRRYVDVDVLEPGDGRSWCTAFNNVQQGINSAYCEAHQCNSTCQVWVAEGTYHVFMHAREDTIRLRPGTQVYGGFAGYETDLEARDFSAHVTILDGRDKPGGHQRVYQVVNGSNASVLDGFTVTGGRAVGKITDDGNALAFGAGGGMFISNASPTVANCIFEGNSASNGDTSSWSDGIEGGGHNVGGGMYINRSYAQVTNCTFSNNSAVSGAGVQVTAASPIFSRCTFTHNRASQEGGGLFSKWSYLTISNSLFSDNSAGAVGGGMAEDVEGDGPIDIANCVFRNNEGGALFLGQHADQAIWDGTDGDWAAVKNSTFWNNLGGAIIASDFTGKTFQNNILWNNSGGQLILLEAGDPDSPSADVSFSLVQGGQFGEGNIDADPLFIDPLNGDLRLQAGSPCIDAADDSAAPPTDALGNPRVDVDGIGQAGVTADMGAFEFQP